MIKWILAEEGSYRSQRSRVVINNHRPSLEKGMKKEKSAGQPPDHMAEEHHGKRKPVAATPLTPLPHPPPFTEPSGGSRV